MSWGDRLLDAATILTLAATIFYVWLHVIAVASQL